MNWEELKQQPSGTILHDEFGEGVRFIVMRGPGSLCAYVGIPIDHPLANQNYGDLPISAHGGLTYSSEGKGSWPEGFYWYGWDYAHSGDYVFYNDDTPLSSKFYHGEDKKWLVKDVIDDSWETLYEFKKLLHLVEKIRR